MYLFLFQANMVKISVFTEKFCSTNDVDVDNNGEETSNDKNGENFPPCVLIDQVTFIASHCLLIR